MELVSQADIEIDILRPDICVCHMFHREKTTDMSEFKNRIPLNSPGNLFLMSMF